jgi:regulator of sirC expression with transglutaminase-like and TPR domain
MVEQIVHIGLVDDVDIELDRAALEIAALDHPGVDLSGYLALLDMIAERLQARSEGASRPALQALRLAEVLAADFGFEGDRTTYDNPANADLIEVLDRRRGLPISLAILYVALARRLGWTAHALNTPSHVLVAIGASQPLVIDPFNRGAFVDHGQLVALLRSALGAVGAVSREHVAPMTNRGALVRLLMNQVTRAERSQQADRALTLLQRITAIAPAYSFAWWDRARLEQATGDTEAARLSLTSMLETTRDPDLRTQIMSALATFGAH